MRDPSASGTASVGRWLRSSTAALLAFVLAVALAWIPAEGSLARAVTPQAHRAVAALAERSAARGFVRVHGRTMRLAGRPFRFVGVNIYDAAATDHYSCRPSTRMSEARLQAALLDLHRRAGATVLRFWAYQTYTAGGTDWSGVDQVIRAARRAGMKVLPVLEDGPGNCTTSDGAEPKMTLDGDTWFTRGYRVPLGHATLSYRDYVSRVVRHYRHDPTVLGWSMMNEAETKARDARGRSALVGFAKDIAGVIRREDRQHLITLGTQSNGAPGASGPDFAAVYGLPSMSFAEVHDWGYWGSDRSAMPGGRGTLPPAVGSTRCRRTDAPVGCAFALARRLHKPIVVGEAGMAGATSAERMLRARLLRAKMRAAFASGATGYLVWSVTTADTDGYDLLLTRNDPLIGELAAMSSRLRSSSPQAP